MGKHSRLRAFIAELESRVVIHPPIFGEIIPPFFAKPATEILVGDWVFFLGGRGFFQVEEVRRFIGEPNETGIMADKGRKFMYVEDWVRVVVYSGSKSGPTREEVSTIVR